DDLGVGDRLAGGEPIAGDGADEGLEAAGAALDVGGVDAVVRPGLPGEVLRLEDMAALDRAVSDEHRFDRTRRDRRSLGRRRGALGVEPGAGEQRGAAGK